MKNKLMLNLVKTGLAASALTIFASGALQAQTAPADDTGWIEGLLDESCSIENKELMAKATRDNIENHVKRAEAAIEPPMPVGDLSCLNDLMDAPLDSFSQIGGILGDLQGGLTGALSGLTEGQTGAGGESISRQVCNFAAEKWAEVSSPLNFDVSSLSIPDLSSNFDLFNNPGIPTNAASIFQKVVSGVNGASGSSDAPAPQPVVSPQPSQSSGGTPTGGFQSDIYNSIGN